MAVIIANNASGKLGGAITAVQTSISLQAGDGSKFPSPTGEDWFPLTVVNSAGSLEIMKCTGRAVDVLTVVRAQEGTAGIAFSLGDRAGLRITQAVLEDATLLKGGTAPIDISGNAATATNATNAANAANAANATNAADSAKLGGSLPSAFAAATHDHATSQVTGLDTALASKIGATNYAASTVGGTVKMRINGSILYIRNDGGNA